MQRGGRRNRRRELDRTHVFDVESGVFEGREAALAHCREWKLAHVLCTASIDEASACTA